MNILIIEDEIITAMDLKKTLEQRGHTVPAICRNYRDAQDALHISIPDLVLIDIRLRLSNLDGIQIAEEITRNHAVPIIYLTSQTDFETFERARVTQPAAYLFKPFRQEELVYQIELAYDHYLVNNSSEKDASTSENVFFPYKKGHQKINKSQVQFIKAEGAYVNVFIENEKKPMLFTMNIGYISQFFTTRNFYKLSRSYIINIDQIIRFDAEFIYFEHSEERIHIPQAQRQEFLKRIALARTPGKP